MNKKKKAVMETKNIHGEFQKHPKNKCFKTGFATSVYFSSSLFFLGGKRKRIRNNQLAYKTRYNRNSPVSSMTWKLEEIQPAGNPHGVYDM